MVIHTARKLQSLDKRGCKKAGREVDPEIPGIPELLHRARENFMRRFSPLASPIESTRNTLP